MRRVFFRGRREQPLTWRANGRCLRISPSSFYVHLPGGLPAATRERKSLFHANFGESCDGRVSAWQRHALWPPSGGQVATPRRRQEVGKGRRRLGFKSVRGAVTPSGRAAAAMGGTVTAVGSRVASDAARAYGTLPSCCGRIASRVRSNSPAGGPMRRPTKEQHSCDFLSFPSTTTTSGTST